MECLGSETVALYVTGDLTPGLRARAELHVDRCPTCRTWIARAARLQTRDAAESTAPESPPTGWPTRGTKIGRYVVGPVVGRGAMGVVLRAEDPVLGRSVALKLLHRAADGTVAHEMLSSEARNLARLSDPHVVQIFDIETWCGRLVIAMELVEGASLRRAAEHANQRERLRMLLLAARGLAAAHAAGVVHRDFKPDNVLCADDGRVLVGDFGLAMLADVDRSEDEMLVGTPAYMPPEQHEGASVDARADQFAFCVTAVEILLGWRPSAIEGPRDAQRFLAATRSLPRPLVRALVRDLSARPEQRAPTMDSLVAALERAMSRSWSPLAWALSVLVPCALALSMPLSHARTPASDGTSAAVVGDPIATGLAHAQIGASEALYAAGDLPAALELVEAAVGTAEASEAPEPLVSALLMRGQLLARQNGTEHGMPDYERAYLVAHRHRLDAMAATAALAYARLIDTENDSAKAELAIEWLRKAETDDDAPLRRARIASTRAHIEIDRYDLETAAAYAHTAIEALAGDHVAEGDELTALLRGAQLPVRGDERYSVLGIFDDVGEVWCRLDRCDDSATASRVVVDRLVEMLGPDHVEVALARVNLATFLGRANHPAAARIELEAALVVLERPPPPDLSALAVATQNLALALHATGEPERAREVALVAITRAERAYGPGAPDLLRPVLTLASVEHTLGDFVEARRHLERALVMTEQSLGADSFMASYVQQRLATLAEDVAERSAAPKTSPLGRSL